MLKKFRYSLLACVLLLLNACSNTCFNSPKSDCLDLPCVPCILPFPVSPAKTEGNNTIKTNPTSIASVNIQGD